MRLNQKKCIPCEGGVPVLTPEEIKSMLPEVKGWEVVNNLKLTKTYRFVNFKHTMVFVNAVADLAESEGHHPDMLVSYGKVIVEIWTHAINGLSENDFILAAKIDLLKI